MASLSASLSWELSPVIRRIAVTPAESLPPGITGGGSGGGGGGNGGGDAGGAGGGDGGCGGAGGAVGGGGDGAGTTTISVFVGVSQMA